MSDGRLRRLEREAASAPDDAAAGARLLVERLRAGTLAPARVALAAWLGDAAAALALGPAAPAPARPPAAARSAGFAEVGAPGAAGGRVDRREVRAWCAALAGHGAEAAVRATVALAEAVLAEVGGGDAAADPALGAALAPARAALDATLRLLAAAEARGDDGDLEAERAACVAAEHAAASAASAAREAAAPAEGPALRGAGLAGLLRGLADGRGARRGWLAVADALDLASFAASAAASPLAAAATDALVAAFGRAGHLLGVRRRDAGAAGRAVAAALVPWALGPAAPRPERG